MRRSGVWGSGLTFVAALGLAVAPAVGAQKAERTEKVVKVEKSAPAGKAGRERRRIEIVRFGGAGYLGVVLEEVSRGDVARLKLSAERGALVKEVEDDSPAAQAGLRAGDVILKYRGEQVESAMQLRRLVHETPVGREVTLEVSRGGSLERLTAVLSRREGAEALAGVARRFELPDLDLEWPEPPEAPEPPGPPALHRHLKERALLLPDLSASGPRKLGIRFQEIAGQLAAYFQLSAGQGVLVSSVDADGPAGRAGMKAGDVILSFDGQPVRDGEDLRALVSAAGAGSEVAVSVQRNGQPLDLKVTLGGRETRRGGGV